MRQHLASLIRLPKRPQLLPHRCIAGAGGNRHGTEEQHIAKTLTWIKQKCPQMMVHVDKITTVGCAFLPGVAFHALHTARVRIAVLTHGDTLSKRALQHQIALAEEMFARNCKDMFFPTAVFVLNLTGVTKQKELRPLVDALFGAYYLNGATHKGLVVSGIPNVGKSSLILPLTKGRTMNVKKKKAYHLPKVGPVAGLTLGIKSHVLEARGHGVEITLYDTPGVRRRLDDCDPTTIRQMVATNSTTFKKARKEVASQKDCVEIVLQALNRHAQISEEPPAYLEHLGRTEMITDVDDFVNAFHALKPDKKVDMIDIIKRSNSGEFGGLIFSGHTASNLERVVAERDLHVHSPIVYCNEFAKTLTEYGSDPSSIYLDPRLEGYENRENCRNIVSDLR